MLKNIPQTYQFTSYWKIGAPIQQVENAITDVHSWKTWWTGLQDVHIVKLTSNYKGGIFQAAWRSATGYLLRMTITITDYKPGDHILFNSAGDLSGNGEWHFIAKSPTQTDVRVEWNVVTTKSWMNAGAPVLRPLFRLNHKLLMNRAEAGLRAYLGCQQHLE